MYTLGVRTASSGFVGVVDVVGDGEMEGKEGLGLAS